MSVKFSNQKHEDGFTLIELLVVILIIGVLASIAIPVFLNQQKAAINAGVQSDVRNTITNVNLFNTEVSTTSSANNVQQTGSATPSTATPSSSVPKLVISDNGTTVGVAFNPNKYTVEGYNSKTNFTYSFSSASGKYEKTPSGILDTNKIPNYPVPPTASMTPSTLSVNFDQQSTIKWGAAQPPVASYNIKMTGGHERSYTSVTTNQLFLGSQSNLSKEPTTVLVIAFGSNGEEIGRVSSVLILGTAEGTTPR